MNLVPPNDDPSSYCRLCLSTSGLQPISSVSKSLEIDLVQLVWKQLEVQLTESDFSGAICTICVQKLEELSECNDDGLLNEWGDDGLLAYRTACHAVNAAIVNRRSGETGGTLPAHTTPHQVPIVLPFQKLSNGRYKCNECPHLAFEDIPACVKHHQEFHQSSSAGIQGTINSAKRTSMQLIDTTTNGNVGSSSEDFPVIKKPRFKCVTCSERFDDIDNLIRHRSVHETTKKPKTPAATKEGHLAKRKRLMIADNDTKCKECQTVFLDKKAFYVHLNGMHNLYICNICDQSFDAVVKLARHKAYHRNLNDIINPFLLGKHSFHCNVCLEKFRCERDIRMHYLDKHEEPENGGFEGFVGAADESTNQVQ